MWGMKFLNFTLTLVFFQSVISTQKSSLIYNFEMSEFCIKHLQFCWTWWSVTNWYHSTSIAHHGAGCAQGRAFWLSCCLGQLGVVLSWKLLPLCNSLWKKKVMQPVTFSSGRRMVGTKKALEWASEQVESIWVPEQVVGVVGVLHVSSILGAGRTTSLALPSSMIATRERRIIQSTFIFLCMYRLYRHTFWWTGGLNLIEWVPMSMGWWLVPHGTKKGFLLSRLSLLTSLKRPFLGRLPRTTGCELSLLDTATETVWFRTAPVVRLLSIQA